eukprot:CAMPEP_0201552610 /NCGR_PEP_ID=MMETSP0173_2-20130828/16813_1 /ASSEMBLY_ACC=CAM_ASM_000268 /TAXON_ID=218659 /ORGANISM="Vexillifera sp., Strain DIVA3 564/2" /LENGTH=274 /DNA_ID=CAMNT_0047963115 /DNA_START=12 /DNA_END=839 /DNA_ORIENTATION=+
MTSSFEPRLKLVDSNDERFWTLDPTKTPQSTKPTKRKRTSTTTATVTPLTPVRKRQRALYQSPSSLCLSRRFKFYYYRPTCADCKSFDEFLSSFNVPLPKRTAIRKSDLRPAAVLSMCNRVSRVIVIKPSGKLSEVIRPGQEKLSQERVEQFAFDKAGLLRTPFIQVGDRIVIGFSESIHKSNIFFGNASPVRKMKRSATLDRIKHTILPTNKENTQQQTSENNENAASKPTTPTKRRRMRPKSMKLSASALRHAFSSSSATPTASTSSSAQLK